MDIFGFLNQEFVFVIENKVGSDEHTCGQTNKWQTEEYYDDVCERYKNVKDRFFIYLYAEKYKNAAVAKDKHYISITYQEIYDYVIKACMDYYSLSNEGRVFLSNYANNLETEIEGKFPYMALINRELCNNLYTKYKDLLELICDEVKKGKDKCDADIYSFYKTYRKVLNTILLSSEKKDIIYEEKPTGKDMLVALANDGKIIPGDTSYGEFLYEVKGVQFEVDIYCDEEGIYCYGGYYTGNGPNVCSIDKDPIKFDNLNKALTSAIMLYNENNPDNQISSSKNALSELRLRANNKSCNDLWNDK